MAEGETDATRDEPGSDPLVGTVVNGRFHIVRRIARGGMGSVYFATQAPLSRPVAVKVLQVVPDHDTEFEENFRRRFLREASILAKLQHPNIVTLLDYGQIANSPTEHYFMAMEYLRGGTLAQRLRKGRLSVLQSVLIARQIGRGLREAHRCGFIHRDLKPSNIILVPEDEKTDIVKLVDFGIGKIIPGRADAARDATDVTRAGLLLGSPRYMSPEQIRSEPVEARTDLYALGVILFQALTGRLPFEGVSSFDLMLAHCLTQPPQLSDACPELTCPEPLSQLVGALLQKKASNRPTLEDFMQRLAAIEERIPGAVSVGRSTPNVPLPVAQARPPPGVANASSAYPRALQGSPSKDPHPAEGEGSSALAVSEPPAPAVRRRGRAYVAFGLAITGVASLCVLLGRSSVTIAVAPAVTGAAASLHAGLPGPRLAAPNQAPSSDLSSVGSARERGTFSLTIDSTPRGATVRENGEVLGVTPLGLVVDRSSVAAGPRLFRVEREGYFPQTLEQGDSETATRVHARLAPSVRADSVPARGSASSRSAVAPGLAAAALSQEISHQKRGDSPGLDIRLRR